MSKGIFHSCVRKPKGKSCHSPTGRVPRGGRMTAMPWAERAGCHPSISIGSPSSYIIALMYIILRMSYCIKRSLIWIGIIYIYTHMYIFAYMFVHAYSIFLYICILYVCICICIYIYIYVYIYIYIDICKYMYIYIYTHIVFNDHLDTYHWHLHWFWRHFGRPKPNDNPGSPGGSWRSSKILKPSELGAKKIMACWKMDHRNRWFS